MQEFCYPMLMGRAAWYNYVVMAAVLWAVLWLWQLSVSMVGVPVTCLLAWILNQMPIALALGLFSVVATVRCCIRERMIDHYRLMDYSASAE